MIIPLSYPLTVSSPLYPGTPKISVSRYRSIDAGDSSDNSSITIASHAGTHLDFPAHFCRGGATATAFFPQIQAITPAYCMDVPVRDSRKITCLDLADQIGRFRDAEALFIRTGWWEIRRDDPEQYCREHPFISEDVPAFLRIHCPKIRLFGIDQISVSSPAHRETGRACHRHFLCHDHPVLLMEDVNLEDPRLDSGPFFLRLFPFIVGDLDGVPVTAFMER